MTNLNLRQWLEGWCDQHPGSDFFVGNLFRTARAALGSVFSQREWKSEFNRLRSSCKVKAYTDCIWFDGKPGWFTVGGERSKIT